MIRTGWRNVESARHSESDLPIKAPPDDDGDLDKDIAHDDQQDDDEGQLWPACGQFELLGANAYQGHEECDDDGRKDVSAIAMFSVLSCRRCSVS